MGRFFQRILIQDKGMPGFCNVRKGILAAASAIGYVPCNQNSGIPVRLMQNPDSEWFELDSALLESDVEIAETFLTTIAKESRIPILSLACVDSDFVVARLLDYKNGTDICNCIGTPYMPVEESEDFIVWENACKKKWKCKAEQFHKIFTDSYVFAEDGLEPLAKLLHFTPPIEREPDAEWEAEALWFIRSEEQTDATRPRTVLETTMETMEAVYAKELIEKGYRRFQNSPLRWHKVVGEPGNEVLLSIVIIIRYGCEVELLYGSQSLYCPVVFSDQYFPHHDEPSYWKEAQFEFVWKFGRNNSPLFIPGDPKTGRWDEVLNLTADLFRPYFDKLIFPEHDSITDFASCHRMFLQSNELHQFFELPLNRSFLEAVIAKDKETSQQWFQQIQEYLETYQDGASIPKGEQRILRAYETGGVDACKDELKKVYLKNMQKLREAGIIDSKTTTGETD